MAMAVGQTIHAIACTEGVRTLIGKLIESLAAQQAPPPLRGYEKEFSCVQCSQLLFHPVTGPCGYSFCNCCTSETVRCKHCFSEHEPTSFLKLNVVLDTILEHCYPEEYAMRTLEQEGDLAIEIGSFKTAEAKFTKAIIEDPYDTYAIYRRALARKNAGNWENALADVISAKIRTDYIPDSLKRNRRRDFLKLASHEDKIIQKASKVWLEVLSHLDRRSRVPISTRSADLTASLQWCRLFPHTSKDEIPDNISTPVPRNFGENYGNLSNKITLSELNSALDTIIGQNMSNLVSLCSKETCPPTKRLKRVTEKSRDFDETDFCCSLCTRLFYDPVCTPCGHTVCLDCLERCLDHGSKCPICKTSLEDIYQYQKCLLPIDRSLDAIIKKHFPELSADRERSRREEQEKLRETLPVFVCIVAFPSVKCILHVFEPRYRLLIRRATRVHRGNIGITTGSNNSPFHNVGTTINVQEVSMFQDGRSLVTSIGTNRFEVEEYGTCDGYNTAKVKQIVDEEEGEEDAKETQRIAKEVYSKSKEWYSRTSDRFKEVIKVQYGDFPELDEAKGDDGPDWPWWVLATLPVNDEVKAHVLAKNRLRTRLVIINLILQKIEEIHRAPS